MAAKGYWIVHITVIDAQNDPRYIAADASVFAQFKARFLVRGGRYSAVEGAARQRHVVIEFETNDAALSCYHSPEYQAAARLRQTYAESEVLILEGQSD